MQQKKFGILTIITIILAVLILIFTMSDVLTVMGIAVPGEGDQLVQEVTQKIIDGEHNIVMTRKNTEEIDYVIHKIYTDPYLFWLDAQWRQISIGKLTILMFKPKYDDIETTKQKIDNIVDAMIAENIKNDDSEYDKVLKVHDWLCDHIIYTESYKDADQDLYGAIVLGQARCAGYAKSFKYILDKLDIKSDVIAGTTLENGHPIEHAWNMIYIDGDPYYFDITWDDEDEKDGFSHIWFGITKEEFELSHTPANGFEWENADNTEYCYYIKNNMYLTNYSASLLANQIKKQGTRTTVKCKDFETKEQVIEALQDQKELGKVLKESGYKKAKSIRYTENKNSTCIQIDVIFQ